MPRSSSRPTTTGPTPGCWRPTTARSRTRATCRSSSTTSRRGRAPTSTPTRSCGSPTHPRVVAVKEASGNLEQIARICRDRPRDVAVLAGDDAWTLPVLALGGDGVVSVASNEIPGELVALCAAARAGDWDDGPPDPRALAAALPRQLPGRPQPGAGQGGARAHGPARQRRRPGAASPARSGWQGSDGRHPPRPRPRRSRRRPDARTHAGRGRRWHDRVDSVSTPRPPAGRRRRPQQSTPTRSSTTSRPGASGPPNPTIDAADGWRVRPEVKAAILARFADRTTRDWTAGPLSFRDRAAVPPRDDLAGGPWRIVPGGTAVRAGRPPRRRRGRDAAVVRQRRRLRRRRHDGRFARARRVVRPDRRAGPPRGRRDDRRRARAARRPAGHRRGRRIRRCRLRAARGRARPHGAVIGAGVTLTGHVAPVRPGPRPGHRGHGGRAPGRAAGSRGRARGPRRSTATFATRHGLSVATALLVKDRDAGTSARVALEEALR